MFEVGQMVKCVNNAGLLRTLTVGKEYEVLESTRAYVHILNNEGGRGGYTNDRFVAGGKAPVAAPERLTQQRAKVGMKVVANMNHAHIVKGTTYTIMRTNGGLITLEEVRSEYFCHRFDVVPVVPELKPGSKVVDKSNSSAVFPLGSE